MCDCPEAQRWRAWWTPDAIAERLAAELDCWTRAETLLHISTSADVHAAFLAARGPGWWKAPSYAELEARRAVPGDWRAQGKPR